jgi:hypothetical protein
MGVVSGLSNSNFFHNPPLKDSSPQSIKDAEQAITPVINRLIMKPPLLPFAKARDPSFRINRSSRSFLFRIGRKTAIRHILSQRDRTVKQRVGRGMSGAVTKRLRTSPQYDMLGPTRKEE